MARKFKSAVDGYKSKMRNRRRNGGDVFYNTKVIIKSLPKIRRKKKQNKSTSNPTAADYAYFWIFILFIFLAVKFTFRIALLIAGSIFAIAIIIKLSKDTRKNVDSSNDEITYEPNLTTAQNNFKTPVNEQRINKPITTISSLIQNATKSAQGLYPHEILMLSLATKYKTSGNSFQSFWEHEHHTFNPQTILDDLFNKGFLEIADLRTTLSNLKVTELKEELKNFDLKQSGKKEELIERLIESNNLAYLEAKYPTKYYKPSEKGEKELSDNEYIPYLHRTNYMSIWEMNKLLVENAKQGFNYRDIIWRKFNEESAKHFLNKEFGLYRNVRYNMYKFAMEEDKFDTALLMLCETVAYDLNGMHVIGNDIKTNSESYYLKFALESAFPFTTSTCRIPPFIVGELSKMQNVFRLKESDFRSKILENFEKFSLPYSYFTNEECADIVLNEVYEHPRKVSAIYKNAEERIREKLQTPK